VAKQIEAEALATIKWPAGGQYLGDWREGEKLAQNGRGMTWTDAAPPPGQRRQCYNCHQIDKEGDLLRHHRPQPVQLRQAAA
jgi:sulfur-oxidizing protein SoxX